MSKRFKLRLFRVIPSFRFCRPKRASSLPRSPSRLCYTYKPSSANRKAMDLTYSVNFPPPNPPPSTPLHPSGAVSSIECGGGGGYGFTSGESKRQLLSPDYTWSKEPKWLTVGKVEDYEQRPCRTMYSPASSGDVDDDGYSGNRKFVEKKRSKKKKKKKSGKTSAASSGGDSGWFTSEETETFLSPRRSFSNNNSTHNFDDPHETKSKEPSHRNKTVGKLKRWSSYKTVTNIKPSPPQQARVLGRMMMKKCDVEGRVKESVAVVKKSEDPYEDFKMSMLEMILEKQIFNEKDLEELLRCFLTLNSREHHGVIVEAFTEIWEILFGKSPVEALLGR